MSTRFRMVVFQLGNTNGGTVVWKVMWLMSVKVIDLLGVVGL